MNDRFLMSGFEALGNLDEQRDSFIDRNWTARNPFREGLPLHQFHDNELLPVMLLQSVQDGDVRVIELREETGFSLEAVQAFFVSCKLLGKDFNGNVTSEFGIPGSVDLSHTTCTNSLDDFVLSELGAWSEGHG